MIFSATKAVLRCVDKEVLTSGMQQAVKCVFGFSHDWDDLGKTAVFICGDVHKDMVISDGQVIIPHEVLTDANIGKMLRIGVYGIDGSGNVVIPTIMCSAGEILPGADPFKDHDADPTPTIWEQMLADNAETRRVAADERAATEEARDVTLSAKEETETARDEAKSARAGAEDAQDAAELAQGAAEDAQAAAEQAQRKAEEAQSKSETAQVKAEEAQADAEAAMHAVQDMGVAANSLQEGSSATVTKTVDPNTGAVTLRFGIPIGNTGNGIASITLNQDFTITVRYTNGSTWTSGSIRGERGNGIVRITFNDDFTMTIRDDDGNDWQSGNIRGATGNGIDHIEKTDTSGVIDTYTIYFTDGNTWTYQVANSSEASADRITYHEEDPHPAGYAGNAINDLQIALDLVFTWITCKSADWEPRIAAAEEKLSGVEPGAEVNAIMTVKRNGNALTPDGNRAVDIPVPTKVSELQNDSGFLSSETDPTVPSWAKKPTKPQYTAQEVGALPSNTFIPSKTSQLTNDDNTVKDSSYVHTDNNFTTVSKNKIDANETNITKLTKRTDMVAGSVTLSNSQAFPFNNSQVTVPISVERDNQDYIVDYEVTEAVGNVGDIVISAKLVNGFKIEYTGSASSVTVKYQVLGGMA